MKVAFFELEGWEEPLLRDRLTPAGFELVALSREPLEAARAAKYADAEAISVFIYTKVDERLLRHLPRLRLVVTRSTGYDHIDLKAAAARGIAVCHVPNYGEETVAEYALLLILALLRRLRPTLERTARGVFDREGLRGEDLAGKTVGVVGTGRIGSRLARLLAGFGVRLLASDPRENPELVRLGVRYLRLEDLLRQADVVSLHVPYLPSTHHLLSRERIRLMKRGSYLVNTSRGAVVETEAVIEALKEGQLAGVAMDTFEGEEAWMEEALILGRRPSPSQEVFQAAMESFYLNRFENAILTPHNAYNTHQALRRILKATIENLIAFKASGRCRFPVPR